MANIGNVVDRRDGMTLATSGGWQVWQAAGQDPAVQCTLPWQSVVGLRSGNGVALINTK